MKKFISVILAALMLVTVMPFAIFAAEYTEPANQAHACHPVDANGKPVAVDVDMKALYEAEKITIAFDNAKDYNKPAFLVDGNTTTATRLTKGDKTVITITATEAIDFATLKLVVNGKVYDEIKAVIEPNHSLDAFIDGHRISVGYNGTHSFIEFDGDLIAKKVRLY